MDLNNLCIVLVEPQGELNIGSVSRAMMNFGLHDLRLVRPAADHLSDDARKMAVRSTPILEQATVYNDIQAALADTIFSIATTRRFGKYRERFLHPQQAAELVIPMLHKGIIALVFGREDHGLATSDLDKCQRFLTIPTHRDLHSMNLAQAVALCLSHFFSACSDKKSFLNSTKKLASGTEVEALYNHMRKTLLTVDYLDPQNPDHIMRSFRSILGRAQLDSREVRILHGLFSRIDWLDGERRREKMK